MGFIQESPESAYFSAWRLDYICVILLNGRKKNSLLKDSYWSWGDGSAVKRVFWSSRGSKLGSQNSHQMVYTGGPYMAWLTSDGLCG